MGKLRLYRGMIRLGLFYRLVVDLRVKLEFLGFLVVLEIVA